jgi:hypothetical protein
VAAVGVQRRRVVGKAHAEHRNSKTDYFNRVQQGAPKKALALEYRPSQVLFYISYFATVIQW